MNWLNVDAVRFNEHGAILRITEYDLHSESILQAFVKYRSCANIDELELFTTELIRIHRPDLAGCTIWFIGFEYSDCSWQIGVHHESLPPIAPGERRQVLPLFK